jgi:hypothetical protein
LTLFNLWIKIGPMKPIDIARKHTVSAMFVSLALRGKRYTTDRDLAVSLAGVTGKKPIEHIPEKLRDTYLRAWPELGWTPEAA